MDHKEPSKIDKLFTHGEEYLKTRQELSKLIALQKTSGMAATLFSSLIIFFLFFFVIVFASVALAYVISLYTGQTYIGFLSVAALYLLAGLILHSKRKKLLEEPVANTIIHNFLNTNDDEQN